MISQFEVFSVYCGTSCEDTELLLDFSRQTKQLKIVSQSVVSDSLWVPRLPHPPPSPGVCSNSCPSIRWTWCHPTISSFVVPFSSCPQSFSAQRLFQWVSSSHQVAKYGSFSISPSNDHSGLISFRIDWFDLLAVHGPLKSLLQHHSSKASILRCSAFFIVQLLATPWTATH